MTISSLHSDLMEKLRKHWNEEPQWQQIIQDLKREPASHPHYRWQHYILTRKGKLVVGHAADLQQIILAWMHSSPQGGHSGIEVTMRRIQTLFYW